MLVQGYSRRLEPWVRRLVYGERPGGFAVLIGLADELARWTARRRGRDIADSARRGLAVPWAAFWAPTARPGCCGSLVDLRGAPARVLVLTRPIRLGRRPPCWHVADDQAPLPGRGRA